MSRKILGCLIFTASIGLFSCSTRSMTTSPRPVQPVPNTTTEVGKSRIGGSLHLSPLNPAFSIEHQYGLSESLEMRTELNLGASEVGISDTLERGYDEEASEETKSTVGGSIVLNKSLKSGLTIHGGGGYKSNGLVDWAGFQGGVTFGSVGRTNAYGSVVFDYSFPLERVETCEQEISLFSAGEVVCERVSPTRTSSVFFGLDAGGSRESIPRFYFYVGLSFVRNDNKEFVWMPLGVGVQSPLF